MERMTIKAIHTPEEHRSAVEMISRIMSIENPDESDLAMMETLAILAERYEQKMFPLEQPTALEAIRFRMDQMDLNNTELAELIGFPKSRISDMLNGKRPPSLEMIRKLHEKLGIPSDILINRPTSAIAS